MSALPSRSLPEGAPQEEKKPSSSSKKSSKSVELDEKLWSQTQISVSSWADCDDEDEGFDNSQGAGAPPFVLLDPRTPASLASTRRLLRRAGER